MGLVAVDTHNHLVWESKPTSSFIHHHAFCCDTAKAWLLGMSKSFEFSNVQARNLVAPTWLNQYYEWGPSAWPLPWCEAICSKQIDCGVFAAFAKEIFRQQGFEAYSGQVIQRYEPQTLFHLKKKWENAGFNPTWISRDCVYHEVCAVRVNKDQLRIYDPTDGLWLDPDRQNGAGSVISLRAELPVSLSWGQHVLLQDQWLDVI